ncbi:MAG: hypothetical protein IT439_07610 [Phycisphaerales bacterium]|nr:hypothetical protein [Phycisphaerales bacterium]
MPRRANRHAEALVPVGAALLCAWLAGCQTSNEPGTWTELFPHVRVNPKLGAVEFDAEVRWDFHHPEEPDTLLEQIVCTPDSKEHESLAVTLAAPSHVHAAMLALGFTPGHPGGYVSGPGGMPVPVAPEGDAVDVRFVMGDPGHATELVHPFAWVRLGGPAGPSLLDAEGSRAWSFVFGGSRIVHRQGRDWYDADMAGEFIGLCTFGGETIGLSEVVHHDSSVQAPLFYVDSRRAPPFGTALRVRITRTRAELGGARP